MFCLTSSCKESWVLSQLVWVICGSAQKWRRGFGHSSECSEQAWCRSCVWGCWPARTVPVQIRLCQQWGFWDWQDGTHVLSAFTTQRNLNTNHLSPQGSSAHRVQVPWRRSRPLPALLPKGQWWHSAPGPSLLAAAQADSAVLASVRLSSWETECQAGEDDPWDPGAFHGHHLEAVSRFSSHQ